MGKAPGRAGEARRERDDGAARARGRLVLEGGADNGLHAADVDELEGEGARAGGVDAGSAVALGQPQELLGLAEAGPRKGPAEQDGHELADGAHYAYQFRGNGTFTGFNMGKEIRGTWRLAENEFCWTQRKSMAVEECFEVERRGNEVRLLRGGYEAFSGKLSPLKAQAPTGESR